MSVGQRCVSVWCGSGAPFDGVDYATRWRGILNAAGFDYVIRHYLDAALEDAPRSGLHLIVGSEVAVSDTRPQMQSFRELIREAIGDARAGGGAVLGVCFGAQAIAAAIGGPRMVAAAERGIEVGASRVDDLALGCERSVVQFHYEEISSQILQLGADLEFTNAHSMIQGFSFGARVRGVQFHPEFDADDACRLVEHNAEITSRLRKVFQPLVAPPSTGQAHELSLSLLRRTFE